MRRTRYSGAFDRDDLPREQRERGDVITARHVEGGEEAVEELTDWLLRVRESCDTEEAPHVELFAGRQTSIWDAELGFSDEIGPFVRDIVDTAERHCIQSGVGAFRVEIRGRRLCKRFQLSSPEPDVQMMTMPIPASPDLAHIVGQQMLHNERLFEMTMRGQRDKDEIVMRALREARQELKEYHEREREMLTREMRLRDMAFARRHMEKEFEQKEERRDRLVEGILAVVKQIAAVKFEIPQLFREPNAPKERRASPTTQQGRARSDPAGKPPIEARFISFLKMLRPEQLQGIAFDHEQQRFFIELFEDLMQWDEEQMKRSHEAESSPKSDAPTKAPDGSPKKANDKK